MSRVKFDARQEYEYLSNFKILQNYFKAKKIDKVSRTRGGHVAWMGLEGRRVAREGAVEVGDRARSSVGGEHSAGEASWDWWRERASPSLA